MIIQKNLAMHHRNNDIIYLKTIFILLFPRLGLVSLIKILNSQCDWVSNFKNLASLLCTNHLTMHGSEKPIFLTIPYTIVHVRVLILNVKCPPFRSLLKLASMRSQKLVYNLLKFWIIDILFFKNGWTLEFIIYVTCN